MTDKDMRIAMFKMVFVFNKILIFKSILGFSFSDESKIEDIEKQPSDFLLS